MSFDILISNGDLVIKNGDIATVSGQNKLIQDILKIALTTAGSNVLQPWYGSLISKTLIGSYLSNDIIISVAKSQLQNALDTLKNLQNIQAASGQRVSPSEQISFITNLSIVRNTIDPRLFTVVISVLDRSFGKVSASFNVNNT